MCILIYSDGDKISDEAFKNSWDHNPDGGGFAWWKDGTIYFEKGFMEQGDFYKAYHKSIPKGAKHIIHFRFGTSGSIVKELTHPFIISERSPLLLKGKLSSREGDIDGVLFHNGVVSDWKTWVIPLALQQGELLDKPISDTRLAAIVTKRLGTEALEQMDSSSYRTKTNRFIVGYPDEVLIIGEFIDEDGILYSNTDYRTKKYRSTYNTNTAYGYGYDRSRR